MAVHAPDRGRHRQQFATGHPYQHYILNHTADIAGDEAHTETYYLFTGTDREPANHMTIFRRQVRRAS